MAKFMGSIMTVLAAMVIAFASSGCKTTNVTERGDRSTVSEKTTEKSTGHHGDTEKVTTETKTTRD